jgi:hypothetical protein
VDVVEGQVPPDVAKITEVAEQFAHHWLSLAAVGALEVSIFHQRDRRVLGATDVVSLRING